MFSKERVPPEGLCLLHRVCTQELPLVSVEALCVDSVWAIRELMA